jgi:cytochrome c peroxidase
MPIAGTAYSPFLFWDGRKDSQWAQALGPLESTVEHGGTPCALRPCHRDALPERLRAHLRRMPDLRGVPDDDAARSTIPSARAAWERLGAGAARRCR